MSRTSSNVHKNSQKSSKNRRNRRKGNQQHSTIASDTVHPTINHEEQKESGVLINQNNTTLEEPVEMPCITEETSDTEQRSEYKEESRTKKPTKSEGSRKPSNELERLTTVSSNQSNAQRQNANEDNSVSQAYKFVLQNTIGRCNNYDQDHNLNNQICPVYDYYKSVEHYQKAYQSMQRSNMIAQGNYLIRTQPKSHNGVKVRLRSQQNIQRQFGFYEKRVILKAVAKRDQYSLEEKLITGKRLCIITKAQHFCPLNLRNNAFSTHLCFIGKDNQFGFVVDCLEDMEIPASTTEQWDALPLEDEAPLRHNEYYLIDRGSIVSSTREYSAVANCKDSPLMEAIITNNLSKYNLHQKTPSIANKEDFLTQKGRQGRKKLDSFQAEIVQRIGEIQKGVSLIQGLPGAGKTEIITEIAQNEVVQIRKSKENQKDKVMICTTSNAGANNNHQKLLRRAANWKKDPPKVLRVSHAEQIDEMHLSSNFHHLRETRALGTQNKPNKWTVTLRWRKRLSEEQIKRLKTKGGRNKYEIRLERKKIEDIQEKIVKINKEMSRKRHELERIDQELMEEFDIIICTLNITGMKKIAKFYRNRVRCLLIDEANQATEVSTLIPFATLVEKVVLVGNKYQLRPTVKTSLSSYSRSLFQRLSAKNKPFILETQYRMTQEIMEFPNQQFCKGKLKCIELSLVPMPECLSALKNKSMFFDVTYGTEQACQRDFVNRAEAECILTVIKVLTNCDENLTIGVIAAYKQQVKLIESQIFCLNLQENLRKNVHVDTIEAFQGLQMDVVIFSTARSNTNQQIGALYVKKRLNLAFTRAKFAFFVFGSAKTLCGNETWKNCLDYHMNRGSIQAIKQEESKTFFTQQ